MFEADMLPWYPHIFPSSSTLAWGISSSLFILSDSSVHENFIFEVML